MANYYQTIRWHLLAVCWLLVAVALQGQSISRAVIGASGQSLGGSTGNHLRFTLAQAPGVGTLQGGQSYLRQGFQQPAGCAAAPRARFALQPLADPACGGPYALVYLDEARSTTTFAWDLGTLASPERYSTVSAPQDFTYLAPGQQTIFLTVSTEDCVDTLSRTFTIQAAPLQVAENRLDLLCREDADGAVSLYIQGGTAPYEVRWNTGDAGAELGNLPPGEYSYSLLDANQCPYADTVWVQGPDSLLMDLAITNESCNNAFDGSITATPRGGTWPYDFTLNGMASTSNPDQLGEGLYTMEVSDANGCVLRVFPQLLVDCEQLDIYDLITPNGDDRNDNWVIEGIELFPNNLLEIYDRWGKLVYSQAAYSNNWYGQSNRGEALPAGAYYYLLFLNNSSGAKFSGSVTILR